MLHTEKREGLGDETTCVVTVIALDRPQTGFRQAVADLEGFQWIPLKPPFVPDTNVDLSLFYVSA